MLLNVVFESVVLKLFFQPNLVSFLSVMVSWRGHIAAPLGGADLSQEASHLEGLCSHLLLMKEYVCVEFGAWPSKTSKQARLVERKACFILDADEGDGEDGGHLSKD